MQRLMTILITAVGIALFSAILPSAEARPPRTSMPATQSLSPQVVIDWSNVANSTETNAQFNARIRLTAMVTLAMHDAINAIPGVGRYHTYQPSVPADANTSPIAAVNEAAYVVMDRYLTDLLTRGRITQARYDRQHATIVALHSATLSTIPDGAAKTNGIAVGAAVGDVMWDLRANDGWDPVPAPPYPYATIHEAPTHPDLPVLPLGAYTIDYPVLGAGNAHVEAPARWWWGDQQPWVMHRPDQFRSDPPPSPADPNFLADLDETWRYGGIASTVRTADQTHSAQWWQSCEGDHPLRMGQQLAGDFNLDLVDTARVIALVSVSMADGLISNVNSKNFYNFWRPITAIRKMGLDQEWTPLFGGTIGNQEYPAGHPMVSGGAGIGILELLFAEKPLARPLTITAFPSNPTICPNPTRSFTSLREARLDVVSARVWGGVHFRGSGMEGMNTGLRVARWIYSNSLLPR